MTEPVSINRLFEKLENSIKWGNHHDIGLYHRLIGEQVYKQHKAKPERKEKMTEAKRKGKARSLARLILNNQKIKRLQIDIAIQESNTAGDKVLLESLKRETKHLRKRNSDE